MNVTMHKRPAGSPRIQAPGLARAASAYINPAIKYLTIVIPAKAGIQEYTGYRIKPACCRQVRHDGGSLFNRPVNTCSFQVPIFYISNEPQAKPFPYQVQSTPPCALYVRGCLCSLQGSIQLLWHHLQTTGGSFLLTISPIHCDPDHTSNYPPTNVL